MNIRKQIAQKIEEAKKLGYNQGAKVLTPFGDIILGKGGKLKAFYSTLGNHREHFVIKYIFEEESTSILLTVSIYSSFMDAWFKLIEPKIIIEQSYYHY